jgi:hypothetical protein
MSASLMVLIPLVLLGLVSTLCFVGCALIYDYSGYTFQSEYQGKVVNDPNIVACWPLNDQTEAPIDPNGTPALDIGPHKINGVYNSPTTGAVKLNQTQIVPGDEMSACAFFNGGFVQVGFDNRLNPATSFSIEAWVQPEWKLTDTGMVRIVVASDDSSKFRGYQLHATAENHWAASIGTGSQFVIAKPDAASPTSVKPGVPNYLVATFDAMTNTLSIFVNGSPSAQATIPMGQSFAPAVTPTPLSIAMGDTGTGKPQSPFNGEIQDVAFYKAALDQMTISQHFNLGSA